MFFLYFYKMKIFLLIILFFLSFGSFSIAQTSGDYRSVIATGNWNTLASWERFNGTIWATPTVGEGYPGQNSAPSLITIQAGHTITTNVAFNRATSNLVVDGTIASTVSYTFTLNNLTISSTGNFNCGFNTLVVSGITSISGTLMDNSTSGANTFIGNVIINSGGIWNFTVAETAVFRGGITHNGTTFTSGAGTYTFNTNSQSIEGSSQITFSGAVTITGASVVVTNNTSNVSGLTITGTLSGTGGFTNPINGLLYLKGSNTITSFTASANPNTVNYSLAGNQTVKGTTYHHLTISGSGTKTLNAATSINGNLSISAGTLACAQYQITGNATGVLSLAAATGLTLGSTTVATDVSFPTNFTSITLATTSTVSYVANINQTINTIPTYGNLTISGGASVVTKTLSSTPINIVGNLVVNTATVTMNFGSSTVNLTGSLSGSGNVTFTTGRLNISGNSNGLTGSFNCGTSTVSVQSSTANQTIKGTNYYNLWISKSATTTATLSAATTINGGLSISAGTLSDGGFQIIGNATGYCNLSAATTLRLGTAALSTSFPTLFTTANISLNTTSKVSFYSNLAQTISATPIYGILDLYSTAAVVKTASNNVTVNGNLVIGTNNTFADGGYIVTVKGNLTNSATHSGAGKILLTSGTVIHTISGGIYGNIELDDVTYGASIAGVTITITGDLTITNGTLSITSATGTKTFMNLIVNNGATFTNTSEAVTFNGNIQNDGVFTSGTGIYTLLGNGKTISGTNTVSITSCTITSPGSYTNNGTLTITTTLAGTGTLINGSNAVLNLNGTSTVTTLDASANPNTVNYIRTIGTQTIKSATYHHLNIEKGIYIATLGGAISVNGNLIITSGILADGGYQITGNATGLLTMGASTTLRLGTTTVSTQFPLNFTTGNISLDITSKVSYYSNLAQSISASPNYGILDLYSTVAITKTAANNLTVNGNLIIGTNNTLADAGYTITVKGNLTNSATHSGVGKILLTQGTAIHTISGGTYGNVELDDLTYGASIAGVTITSTGTLTITNGTLSITSATGTKTFMNIIVTPTGILNNSGNSAITLNGNLQNDGTFTSGTGTYTLLGAGKTISGINPISINTCTITTPGSYTNNAALSILTALSGTGTLINGSNSILNIGGTSTITTLTASTNPNTVYYTNTTSAQTIKATTYHNLGIVKSAQTATLGGATIVNNNLTITSGILADGGYQITGNATGLLTISAGATLRIGSVATATVFPTNFTNGNISIAPTGTVSYYSNLAQNISEIPIYGNLELYSTVLVTKTALNNITLNGNLIVNSFNTFADAGFIITIKGNISMSTSSASHTGLGKLLLTSGSTTHTISGGTFGNIELDDTYGASIAGVTITSTGTITLTNGTLLITSATGTKTFANLTIDTNGVLNNSGNSPITLTGNLINNGTLTAGLGLVTISGTASQSISGSVSFYSLTLNKSLNNLTINNDLTISGYLNLTSGKIITGVNNLIISNSLSTAIQTYSSSSFVNGNLRRYISTNTNTYAFPIAKGNNSTDYYRIDFINNNLVGTSYLTANLDLLTESANNIDTRISTIQNSYPIINATGETILWNLTPNANPSSGNYGVNLYIANISALTDNQFYVIERNLSSTDYVDWNTNYATTTIPADGLAGRTVISGYSNRTGLNSFGQFTIGIPSLYYFQFLLLESQDNEQNIAKSVEVILNTVYGSQVTVDYSITGTATNGSDFTLSAGTLTYPIGITSQNINFNLLNDSLVESAETIILTLSNPTLGLGIGLNSNHTFTINDEDSNRQIEFQLANISGYENQTKSEYWEWVKQIAGTGKVIPRSMTLDSEKNIILLLEFSASVTVNSQTFNSSGTNDNLLIKYNPEGVIQWVKQSGSDNVDTPLGVQTDSDNNIYITGGFKSTAYFGTKSILSTGTQDAFLTKYNSLGEVIWAKNIAWGADISRTEALYVTNNEIFLVGLFKATVDFGGTTLTVETSEKNTFITKLDTSGAFIWATKIKSNHLDTRFYSITSKAGNCYIAGGFVGQIYINADTYTSSGLKDLVLIKIDTNGNFGWVKTGGGTSDDYWNAIDVDLDGNIYLTGAMFGNGTIGLNNISISGTSDLIYAKYNSLGDLIFANNNGGLGKDVGLGITVGHNTVQITGYFSGLLNWGENSINTGSTTNVDAYVGILDYNGVQILAKIIEGNSYDQGSLIKISDDGNAYVSGYSTSDFIYFNDSTFTRLGIYDAFISKYKYASLIPIVLNNLDLEFNTTVDYSVTGGSATGTDYSISNGTVIIEKGQTTSTFGIILYDDIIEESAETIQISLSNPKNSVLGVNSVLSYTIIDNDIKPTISFSRVEGIDFESTANHQVEVVLSNIYAYDVEVDYTVTGTATNGQDFTLSNGTLIIATDSTHNYITIPIISDNDVESTETIILTLSNPVNGFIGLNNTYTLSIYDLPQTPVVDNVCRNGSGVATLNSSSSTNVSTWYNQAIGGSLLSASRSYTTPNLNSTTNYYVSAARVESSLDFSSTSGYVRVPNSALLDMDGTLTIEMKIKSSAWTTRQYPLNKLDKGEGRFSIEIGGNPNFFYGNNTNYTSGAAYQNVPTNEWTHVAIVRNIETSTLSWYINGVFIRRWTAIYSGAQSAYDLILGHAYDGELDEVRIWNTARTVTEIINNKDLTLTGAESGLVAYYNMNNGHGLVLEDLSPNNLDGILVNMDSTTVWKHNSIIAESNRVQATVTVNSNPVDLGVDRTVSGSTVLDATSGYSTYLWNNSTTAQTLTVSQTGTYWVSVVDAGGCFDTDTVVITVNPAKSISNHYTKGEKENENRFQNTEFKVYPNPVSEGSEIYINLSGIEPSTQVITSVYDALGKQLYFKTLISDSEGNILSPIENIGLSSGVYMIVASTKENVYKLKFVVE